MRRGATKEEVILTTRELITRNGIRAVRVDEIAQSLGISKRTLYEMFNGKTELMNACLEAMSQQQQERLAAYRKRRSGNTLQRVFKLAYEYIENLFTVDSCFLLDIKHKVTFAEHFEEHRKFWSKELMMHLETCREEDFLLPEVDASALAEQILNTLLELRLKQTTLEELRFFCRTLIRGAATQKGIEWIDSK